MKAYTFTYTFTFIILAQIVHYSPSAGVSPHPMATPKGKVTTSHASAPAMLGASVSAPVSVPAAVGTVNPCMHGGWIAYGCGPNDDLSKLPTCDPTHPTPPGTKAYAHGFRCLGVVQR